MPGIEPKASSLHAIVPLRKEDVRSLQYWEVTFYGKETILKDILFGHRGILRRLILSGELCSSMQFRGNRFVSLSFVLVVESLTVTGEGGVHSMAFI